MEQRFVGNVFPEDHKEGYGETENEFYPYGTIKCDNSQFGEYAVPDIIILEAAKKMAATFFKNHNEWSAQKVARKVAEKMKLKKFDGQVREGFFGILNSIDSYTETSDLDVTIEDVRDWKEQLAEAHIEPRQYVNPLFNNTKL